MGSRMPAESTDDFGRVGLPIAPTRLSGPLGELAVYGWLTDQPTFWNLKSHTRP